jgi:hypothetical protein
MLNLQIRTTRHDAGPSLFLAQELEAVISEQYRAELAPLKILELIPVKSDFDPRCATIAYSYLTQVGSAAVLRLPSAEIPRVDLYRQKFQSTVKTVATMYGWGIDEMESAEMAGVPLDREGADAARRVIAEKVSDIAINGHSPTQLPGLLSNPNIPRTTVPNGAAASPLWSTKTGDEILLDMNNCANSIVSVSKGAYQPDTLLLPIDQFNLISGKARSTDSDETVLSYFLKTNPYIKKVDWLRELDVAGTGETDVMLAFKYDPSCFFYAMVMALEQRPAQEKDLRVDVVCREKTGGVVIPKPLALAIYEGI